MAVQVVKGLSFIGAWLSATPSDCYRTSWASSAKLQTKKIVMQSTQHCTQHASACVLSLVSASWAYLENTLFFACPPPSSETRKIFLISSKRPTIREIQDKWASRLPPGWASGWFIRTIQLDCRSATRTRKTICQRTRRVATLSRPPLESSWQGDSESFRSIFV